MLQRELVLLTAHWGARGRRREGHWVLEGCRISFLLSFFVNMLGLKDKREQLSDSGFIGIGSAHSSPSSGAEHDPDEAVVGWTQPTSCP